MGNCLILQIQFEHGGLLDDVGGGLGMVAHHCIALCSNVVVARNAGGPYLVSTNCYNGDSRVV